MPQPPAPAQQQTTTESLAPAGHYRWVICALLFFAATVNYVDRQVIGLLKPVLQSQLHWNEIDYSNIISAFQLAYAIGTLLVGRAMDWLGTRKGFSLSVFVWSIAAMAHALATSVFGFSIARIALGLGEAGNFPASVKTVAEWFPKKERALATGLFNSGTNIGAIITPLIIPWFLYKFGWQGAFIGTGALGFLWLIFWLTLYRSPETHKHISAAELAYIRRDPDDSVVPLKWTSLLGHRQLWAVTLGKFMTDPIWYLFLFWLPDFLYRDHHIDLKGMFLPLVVIYNAATLGSIAGGWLSSSLIRRGYSINRGRKTAMLTCALCIVPIVFASRVAGLWPAVALIGLATAAHQGWSANVYTMASDMFPRRAVGSVIGIASMAGAIGGMLIAKVVGYILQWTGSYFLVFLMAGSAYLTALLLIQLLVPRLEPVQLAEPTPA
jgi:MFS transporter, ACS family, hexuronate transporter